MADTQVRDGALPDDADVSRKPTNRDPFRGLHPIGWVSAGIIVVAAIYHLTGTKYLIGNFSWWHWTGLVILVAMSTRATVLYRVQVGLETIPRFTATIAWLLAWMVFFVQLFNVATRYGNSYVDRDILFGQMTSLAWQSFAMLFLIGVSYGVRTGVNPRIDFWWADFSDKRKAWLDFVLHVTLLMPFIVMAARILRPYAAISLGQKRDGTWPSGWRVWNTWEQSPDADQLPVGPIKAMIFISFILFGLQIFAEIIKTGFAMMERTDLVETRDSDAPLRVE